jgi:hypothetical protein
VNVLVIPEDFPNDQYVLKPVVEAMLKHLGRPRARVVVCREPRLRGVAEALNWESISDIIKQYPAVDLFLLCVDRDGNENRRLALNGIEVNAGSLLPPERLFLAENAWQEIEVWLLAGHKLPKEWSWKAVRAERDPKERYYEPLARAPRSSRFGRGSQDAGRSSRTPL